LVQVFDTDDVEVPVPPAAEVPAAEGQFSASVEAVYLGGERVIDKLVDLELISCRVFFVAVASVTRGEKLPALTPQLFGGGSCRRQWGDHVAILLGSDALSILLVGFSLDGCQVLLRNLMVRHYGTLEVPRLLDASLS
jgi:hypothetical protein